MNELIELLHRTECSCVLRTQQGLRTFMRRGVADLYDLFHENPRVLAGAQIADKVVGKAAATFMILGKVTEVYAELITPDAIRLFEKAHIPCTYGKVTDRILNRDQTDTCPMDKMCGMEDWEKNRESISRFIEQMRGKK